MFIGRVIRIEPGILGVGLDVVLLIPFAASLIARKLLFTIKSRTWLKTTIYPGAEKVQLALLCLAITPLFASHGRVMLDQYQHFIRVVSFHILNLTLGASSAENRGSLTRMAPPFSSHSLPAR